MEKLVRVCMSDQTITIEAVPEAWRSLGGRALGAAILAGEVPPAAHPLGRQAKIVFAPGLLAGTCALCSGRLSISAKSPLTGSIKEGNAGGHCAMVLVQLGIKAVIVEGATTGDGWYGLHIDRSGVRLLPSRHLVGTGVSALAEGIRLRFGETAGFIGIGPAGEFEMPAANLAIKDSTSRVRSVGRGGLGAVLGSKRIKFISFDGTGIASAAPMMATMDFAKAYQRFLDALARDPEVRRRLPSGSDGRLLDSGGSLLPPVPVSALPPSARHALPLSDTLIKRAADSVSKAGCQSGCVVPWGRISMAEGRHRATDSMMAALSAGQRRTIAGLLDEVGLDCIESWGMFGLATEAGILCRGDAQGLIRLLTDEIAKGTALGRVLGSGTSALRRMYGLSGESVIKNPLGGTHQPANHVMPKNLTKRIDPHSAFEIATAALDSIGLCLFIGIAALDLPECRQALTDMVAARFGTSLPPDYLEDLGNLVLTSEDRFRGNEREDEEGEAMVPPPLGFGTTRGNVFAHGDLEGMC